MIEHAWNLHDVGVRLTSELPLPRAIVQGMRHHPPGGPTVGFAVTMEIRHEAATRQRPPAGVPVYLARELPVEGRIEVDSFWLRAGEGELEGDLASGRLLVRAPGASWLAENTFVRTLFPLGLALPLARAGLVYVHAAVVVDPDGEGWMLTGGGGAGKSTTAYGLARRGWRYVSDDGALLRLGRGGVEALCFMEEFHLARDLAARFPELRFDEGLRAHPSKGVVEMQRLFPGSHVETARVTRLAMLGREAAPRPDAGAGAARHLKLLLEQNPFVFVNAAPAQLALLTTLVGGCHRSWVQVDARLLQEPDRVLLESLRRTNPAP